LGLRRVNVVHSPLEIRRLKKVAVRRKGRRKGKGKGKGKEEEGEEEEGKGRPAIFFKIPDS